MSERIPCKQCGSMILDITAKNYDGFCAPCGKKRPIWEWSDYGLSKLKDFDIANQIKNIAMSIPDIPDSDLTDEEKDILDKLLETLARCQKQLSTYFEITTIKLMIMGKRGYYKDALQLAEKEHRDNRTWKSSIGLANLYKRMGDIKKSIEFFKLASNLDQKDVSSILEIGDIYLDGKKYREALKYYDMALERRKENSWAIPSKFFCQYMITKNPVFKEKLVKITQEKECECGVGDTMMGLTGDNTSSQGKWRANQLLNRLESEIG